MRRWRAGTRIRRPESNRTRPFNETRPRPGCSKPAMHLSNIVFPAPDGPRMLSGASDALKDTLSSKSGSFFSICTSSAMSTRHPMSAPETLRARPVVEAAEKCQRNHNIHGAPGEGALHFVRFHREVDSDRNRLSLTWDISRDHQRGAEFSKRARKRKYGAGKNTRPCQRKSDFTEHTPLRCAQRSRRLQQFGLHLLKSSARSEIHQREGNDSSRDYRGGPGKNYGCA